MKTLSIIAAIVVSATNAQAHVGETPQQIDTRYKPTQEKRQPYGFSREYSYHGYRVLVAFREGACFSESYRKVPPKPFLESEISALLKEHADGAKWQLLPMTGVTHPVLVFYHTPDNRYAIHDTVKHTLQFSKEMFRIEKTIER